MKYFEWSEEKNKKLMKERGISFEICMEYIKLGCVIKIIDNHEPYEHQKVFLINIEDYIYRVPYVEDDEKFFLKTIYPCGADTKKYLSNKKP